MQFGADPSQPNDLWLIRPLADFGGALARDTPRLTGARSAPYENLRVLRGENIFTVNPEEPLIERSLYLLRK